ncbi:MAG: amidohydrolase family protein [Haloferacaceae archaeon]
MSQQAPRSVDETYATVDCDVHLTIPTDVVGRYLDDPYRTMLKGPSKYQPFATSSWDQYMGESISRRSTDDPDEVHETLAELGIDYPVINNSAIFYRTSRADVAANLMRGYNDAMLDVFLDEYDSFNGLISVAPHEPTKAAEEIDRLGDESNVVGVYVPTSGPFDPLGNPEYDVVYRAAADNDLPVVFHGSAEAFMLQFPRQNEGFNSFLEVHSMAHSWSQMMTLTSLLVNGVPVKFPELEFVFLESGVGWVPYTTYRLNKEYSIRRQEAPLLERSPEEYVDESCYFSSQPLGEPNDAGDVGQLLELVGFDSLVFSSDYPHWDFDHLEELHKHLRSVCTDEERKAVLSGNASDVFDLGV